MINPDRMAALTRHLKDTEATAALGAELALMARAGSIICLSGELGAGKTTLARAILKALGHEGEVPSPTFTLVQPYALRIPVAHLDLYRLKQPEEIAALGFEDLLAEGAALIEWPEMAEDFMPADRLDLYLETEPRRARLQGQGAWVDRAAAVARGFA